MDDNKMVIGLISRLTNQKGLDLVNDVIPGIMDGNTQVGEICREYLCSSGNIDKQAIVVYPMVGNSADLTRGFVVSVLDQVYEEDMPTEVFNVSQNPFIMEVWPLTNRRNSISSYIAGTKGRSWPSSYLLAIPVR